MTVLHPGITLLKAQEASFWHLAPLKGGVLFGRLFFDHFNRFNHFMMKQALKHPLEVPGGSSSPLPGVSHNRDYDPNPHQKTRQKCRNDNTDGVHTTVHGPRGVSTAWCPAEVHLRRVPGRLLCRVGGTLGGYRVLLLGVLRDKTPLKQAVLRGKTPLKQAVLRVKPPLKQAVSEGKTTVKTGCF